MKREITPEVLDRLIATAEGNITKTKEKPGRIWFNKVDRVREMEQTTQALKEFQEVMGERDSYRAALETIADPSTGSMTQAGTVDTLRSHARAALRS